MSWPVWSTRFVYAVTAGIWSYYRVPAGKRAVVKCIAVVGAGVPGGVAYVSVGPTYGLVTVLQAPTTSELYDATLVAYAGEDIGCMRTDDGIAIAVHGFLLDDPLQDQDAPQPAPGPPPGVLPELVL